MKARRLLTSYLTSIYFFVALFLNRLNVVSSGDMDSKKLSLSIATFASKFSNQLDKQKNVVSSPLSVETLLALLTLGSTEPAHSELLAALDLTDDDTIRSAFSMLSSKQNAIKGVTLNVANKVYIMDKGYELHSELEQDAVKIFDTGLQKIDFTQSSAAASVINQWVEDKTNKRIRNLITASALDADTRLVLVNAIYFKGTWQKQFEARFTQKREFHVNSTTVHEVDMMYKEDEYRYGDSSELNAQLLEIFYEGSQASMLIVLPKEIEGLDDVLQKLADGHDFMAEMDKMYTTKVKVSIPKFKIETEIDLKDLLPKMGINAIFSQFNSGLTKLLDSPEPLYVSKAVQKAFIEVNEEGAEAAAVTAGVIRMRRSLRHEHEFIADRPALWCILIGGQVTFVARYHPTATASPTHEEL